VDRIKTIFPQKNKVINILNQNQNGNQNQS